MNKETGSPLALATEYPLLSRLLLQHCREQSTYPSLSSDSIAHATQVEAPLTRAQKRRQERIALIEEFGGHSADFKQVASEAMRRGMYSRRTNVSDVELCLLRTWKLRNRGYSR
jgi:hypothetical protein